MTKRDNGSFEIKATAIPTEKDKVGDSTRPRIEKIVEVVDDEDYEDNPRDSRWSCGGTLIFYM